MLVIIYNYFIHFINSSVAKIEWYKERVDRKLKPGGIPDRLLFRMPYISITHQHYSSKIFLGVIIRRQSRDVQVLCLE